MARKARIEYPGAVYHLINRGNYRDRIFETEGACGSFVDGLCKYRKSMQWCLHAWCLMGLMMATSGCPVLQEIGAMASFHIPFCSTRETLDRTVGSYLTKQFSLTGLKGMLEADR